MPYPQNDELSQLEYILKRIAKDKVKLTALVVQGLKDTLTEAVRPNPELAPLFDPIYQEAAKNGLHGGPDRIRTGDLGLDRAAC